MRGTGRRVWQILLVGALVLFGSITGARAQDLATLVAERVEITGTSVLIAEGNVEIFFQSFTKSFIKTLNCSYLIA